MRERGGEKEREEEGRRLKSRYRFEVSNSIFVNPKID